MANYSDSDLAQAAWEKINAGCTEQEVLTQAEDLANRGETDDAEYWQRVAETMGRLKSHPSLQLCMVCGKEAEETREIENGIQQRCTDCGLFQIVEPLLADWRQKPESYKAYRGHIDAYIGYCTERGVSVRLSDVSMAMIKRGTYNL